MGTHAIGLFLAVMVAMGATVFGGTEVLPSSGADAAAGGDAGAGNGDVGHAPRLYVERRAE